MTLWKATLEMSKENKQQKSEHIKIKCCETFIMAYLKLRYLLESQDPTVVDDMKMRAAKHGDSTGQPTD